MSKKTISKFATLLLPLSLLIFYLISGYLLRLLSHVPACQFYSIFHQYCPACGNTRSVTALLHGDIGTSLRFNIVPILLCILGFFAYIELATYSFGSHIRLVPRRLSFYIILISLLVFYFIMRNFFPYLTP